MHIPRMIVGSHIVVPFARDHTLASSATEGRQGGHNLHEENTRRWRKQHLASTGRTSWHKHVLLY